MALVDERKLKDKAHALIRDGRLVAATDVYVKLIGMNRTDPGLRLRHAELCARLNRYDLAVSSYRVAAHLLAGSGHTAKAHAVLSCAVKLAPTDMGLRRAIRDLRGSPAFTPEPYPPPVEQPAAKKSETIEIVAIELGEDELPTDAFTVQFAS